MTTQRKHELKTWVSEYKAVAEGRKTFEFRRNDRDFAVGDLLQLDKYDPAGGASRLGNYTWPRESLLCEVVYVVEGKFGVPEGWCVMGIRLLREEEGDPDAE